MRKNSQPADRLQGRMEAAFDCIYFRKQVDEAVMYKCYVRADLL